MKAKTLFAVVFLILVLASVTVYFYTLNYPNAMKHKYENLPSTDLSGINFTSLEDNEILSRGRLDLPDYYRIEYNNVRLFTFDECIKALGENYIREDTDKIRITYLDHKNNLQLLITKYWDGPEHIEIDTIEPDFSDHIKVEKSIGIGVLLQFLFLLLLPGAIPESYYISITEHYLYDFFTYIISPLVICIWLIPFIRLVYKRSVGNIILAVLAALYFSLSIGFFKALMSV